MRLVQKNDLEQQLIKSFLCAECNQEESKSIVESLILAEMCGEYSHGLSMLETHIKRIKRRGYNLGHEPIVEVTTHSFARMNCQNNIGMYTAKKCMEYAINMAKIEGVYTVFANNCNTYSSAFAYTLQAANDGLIGFTMCNTPAQMPVYGGLTRLIGTNPISFAVPGKTHDPILFDMATSLVAKSKISAAKNKGENIPEGWAFDKDGNPTTDPNVAMTGLLAPFADGPKGIGLAMMIDLFSGLLSGAACLDQVGFFADDNMNVGQIFIAIDPKIVYGDSFYDRVDEYIDKIHSSRSVGGIVQVPGENKFKNLARTREQGIEIDDTLYNKLMNIADR